MKSEKGISLLETIVALALLSIIGVVMLSGLAGTSTARVVAEEQASAKILAETCLEWVKKEGYATSYNYTIPDEFEGYTANLTIISMKNGNIQKVTVVVRHHDDDVFTLESHKVKRSTE